MVNEKNFTLTHLTPKLPPNRNQSIDLSSQIGGFCVKQGRNL